MRSEIQYRGIHSDLPVDDRQALHRALDEFLDNSSGEGFFFVGNPLELANDLNED